jgi:hypothetical protein
MPPVRLLDPSVIGKIRAGEVVDRPAAVAKELIENALDAGSRLIAIQSASNPDRMIRVQDDGSGMGREDALLAVRRHATSKLERAEDLEAIATLGFRGEALASIAEVSRLTLSTRAADELTGTQIEILGGTTISVSGVGTGGRNDRLGGGPLLQYPRAEAFLAIPGSRGARARACRLELRPRGAACPLALPRRWARGHGASDRGGSPRAVAGLLRTRIR